MTKNHSNFPLPTYYGYFCQRYYDPQIGRFMTLDPFGGYVELPQTQNRYAYCINNPLKYIDPLGLIPPEELLGLDEGLIAWTFYDDIWIGVMTLRPLEGPDPGALSDWLSEGLIGADEGAYSDPWGDDYGGGYLGGSRGGNIRSPYGGSGAGDAPPGGGSAPADVTYTFPKYKFQPYTPPVVPEWRAQPPPVYSTVIAAPPTFDRLSYSTLYWSNVIEIMLSEEMLKGLRGAVVFSIGITTKYPAINYGSAFLFGAALGNYVAQEARRRALEKMGVWP